MNHILQYFQSAPETLWVIILSLLLLLLLATVSIILMIVRLYKNAAKEEPAELNLLQMQLDEIKSQLKIQQLESEAHQAQALAKLGQTVESRLNQTGNIVNQQLAAVTDQLDRRMGESSRLGQSSAQHTDQKLEQTSQAINSVNRKLAELGESNKQIFKLGQSISELHDILKSPKPRGLLGELFLSDMLEQILPKDHFQLQYRFDSGDIVDAVVRFGDHLLPIDSKFVLDNFKKMCEVDDAEGKGFRRKFIKDIKKQIDSIASKYILPGEGTLDLAFMYIPAENVYYETMVKVEDEAESLSDYAIKKRVVPVSPNSLYTYLQLVLLGIRGLKIESNAKEILGLFDSLQVDFKHLETDYNKIGTHLNHAQKSYTATQYKMSKFTEKLENNPANTKKVDNF